MFLISANIFALNAGRHYTLFGYKRIAFLKNPPRASKFYGAHSYRLLARYT